MDRRDFVRMAGGGAAAVAAMRMRSSSSAPPKRPNVVVILADDLGWGEISRHGSPTPTPHIDAFFAESLELGCHMVMPVCSPTRAAFLTGRHPARVGVAPTVINADIGCTMAPEEVTIAQAFSAAGYATACLGKWHLGYVPSPNERGFELFCGLYGAAADYLTRMSGRGYRDWYLNGEPLQEEGYTTDLIAERAVRYIEGSGERPFFLYLPFTAVHNPLQAKESDLARVPAEVTEPDKRTHAAMAIALDDAVGRVLEAIERKGLRDDTIVLFISDNGGTPVGSSLPFRGGKHTLYDGGIRTPAAIRWPGRIARGRRTNELLAVDEWLPTLLALTGVARPEGVRLDGFDASRVLLRGGPSPREQYCWIWTDHDSIRTARWKLLRWRDRRELYDLEADPAESSNLIDERPDVAKRLEARLDAWEASLPCYPSHVPVRRARSAKATPKGDVLQVRLKRRPGQGDVPVTLTLATAEMFQLHPGDRLEYDALIAESSTEGGFLVEPVRGPLPQWVYDQQPHGGGTALTGEAGAEESAAADDEAPARRGRRRRAGPLVGSDAVDQYGVLQTVESGFPQARGRWARRVIGLANLCPTTVSQVRMSFAGEPGADCLVYLDNIAIRRRDGTRVQFYGDGQPTGLAVPQAAAYEEISVRARRLGSEL